MSHNMFELLSVWINAWL